MEWKSRATEKKTTVPDHSTEKMLNFEQFSTRKGKKKGDVVPLTEVDRKRIKLCIEQTKAKTRGVSK